MLGLGLFAWALHRTGLAAIGTELSRVGARAGFLLLPYLVGTCVGALPWFGLLPKEARPTPRGLFAGRFIASSANAFLPFFGLAGEPARLLWLRRDARAAGLAAIVLDRVLYNTSNGLLLFGGAAVAFAGTRLPATIAAGAAAAALAMLCVPLLGLFLVIRFGIGRRAQAVVRRMLGAEYSEQGFGEKIDARLLALVRGPRRPFVLGIATHVLGRAAISVEVYLGLVFLGTPFTLADAVVLAAVPIGLSLVFSSIPSQIGVQESGQAFAAAALGLPPTVGVTLVLLQRFRQVAYAACVPLLLREARPVEPADAELPSAASGHVAHPEP
ncbi:MAG TPA: lysylphosphatidylglycerol synthase transmembrane domain-containing protein [Polyangiaceae bacterium]|nr:lysylphosphatidylglycerol synthase transmembrane domain-containing protein [Polyangiaceae bacterium]